MTCRGGAADRTRTACGTRTSTSALRAAPQPTSLSRVTPTGRVGRSTSTCARPTPGSSTSVARTSSVRATNGISVCWVREDDDGQFVVFRAAKFRLFEMDQAIFESAAAPGRTLVGRLGLTDEQGWPLRDRPPAADRVDRRVGETLRRREPAPSRRSPVPWLGSDARRRRRLRSPAARTARR